MIKILQPTAMLEQALTKLGFSKNETAVYLALFESGKTRARTIIEVTNLHRNLVYQALDALVERGLVTKVDKDGVAMFSANDPMSLLEEIKTREALAREAIDALQKTKHQEEYEVQVFEGIEGMKRARNKTLLEPDTAGETLYVMGGSKFSTVPELESYWRHYHREREKRGVNFKILFDRNTDPEMLRWRNALPLSQAKYLPYSFENPLQVTIFKSLIDISMPGVSPLTFCLRSKEIAAGFKKYFDYFWQQKMRVESGVAALERAIYEMLGELKPGENYNVLGASAGGYNNAVQKLYDRYHRDRIKKGVVVNMLVYKESFERIKKRFSECGDPDGRVSHLRQFMAAPPTPMQINTYQGKMLIILYSDEPVVMQFNEPNLHAGFQAYFDELWQQKVQLLRGSEAVRDIWLESLDHSELRFIGARGYFVERYPEMFAEIEKRAAAKAAAKKLVWRNVVDPSARGHLITKIPWMETKFTLPEAPHPNVVWLYGNKLAIANWTENEPVVFVTTNERLVKTYNEYFDRLWGQTAVAFQGAVGVRELAERILGVDAPLFCIGDASLTALLDTTAFNDFNARRIKKSIHWHMITSASSPHEPPFLGTIKKVAPGSLPPTTVYVFGSYVAHVTGGKNSEVFLVEDDEAANQYRIYFKNQTNSSKSS